MPPVTRRIVEGNKIHSLFITGCNSNSLQFGREKLAPNYVVPSGIRQPPLYNPQVSKMRMYGVHFPDTIRRGHLRVPYSTQVQGYDDMIKTKVERKTCIIEFVFER